MKISSISPPRSLTLSGASDMVEPAGTRLVGFRYGSAMYHAAMLVWLVPPLLEDDEDLVQLVGRGVCRCVSRLRSQRLRAHCARIDEAPQSTDMAVGAACDKRRARRAPPWSQLGVCELTV